MTYTNKGEKMNTPTKYDPVARIAETWQVVTILVFGSERCYIKSLYGEKWEKWIDTEKLEKF